MTIEEFLQEALSCFHPPVQESALSEVREHLLEILGEYQRTGNLRVIMEPVQRIDETDEAHETRSIEHIKMALKKRGRPEHFPQAFLMLSLRGLLQSQGCNYGVLKNGEVAAVVRLAEIVDLMAGMPRGDVDWQSVAVKCANPLYPFELIRGERLNLPPEDLAAFKRSMSRSFRKRYNQKS